MKTALRFTTAAMITGGMLLTTAWSIEPAYNGPMGNPEEPATRPYKAMYRGVKAFFVNPVRSFHEGNDKFPVVGSVETFRGVRRGTVELMESTYTGMAGKRQPDHHQLQTMNLYIDTDRRLAALLDGLTAAGLLHWAFDAPVVTVFGSGGYVILQSEMDISVMSEEERDYVVYRGKVAREKDEVFSQPNRDRRRYFDRLEVSAEVERRHAPTVSDAQFTLTGDLIKKGRRGKLTAPQQ